MSVWLQAARRVSRQTDKTDTTPETEAGTPGRPMTDEVLSVLSVGQFESDHVIAETPSVIALSKDAPRRHGRNAVVLHRTWTGGIVSLDAWRRLTDWERRGPTGKLWCGICSTWVLANAFPGCHGKQVPQLAEGRGKTY
jgi:hypothetical protein